MSLDTPTPQANVAIGSFAPERHCGPAWLDPEPCKIGR